MPATLDEVKILISDAFPGADVSDIDIENHRIGGAIVWDGFAGKDSSERSRLVSEGVRDKLGLRGMNVGILLPLEKKDQW